VQTDHLSFARELETNHHHFGTSSMDCNYARDQSPDKEAIRQEHEAFLTKLEALAVHAIASRDWSPVIDFINLEAPEIND
jgi:hypothetical protein